ncbi:hypothetical protein [Roseateles koreensis]|uniref:Tetratricopeptide repeat protein n=1 Tax=Roseateles koreensis TaxID=2987526 RepID=A0ABT5KNW4_9BURK|nr:hypothetical protein [Roseateles koreensis]MDC8784603.1 hypothetical protein [Roseateles koreensis]
MRIKSRLLKRLDAGIASASSTAQGACLSVQRALLLARHGQMAQAREQLTALHQLAFQHANAAPIAWLQFAEGLMCYYADFSDSGREDMAQALIKAQAHGDQALEALCEAWLAHLAYVRYDDAALLAHARACDTVAAEDDHGARFRLCTVIGLAYQSVSDEDACRAWYARARWHVQVDGDDAALSALMFNQAEMRVSQVRRHRLLAPQASGLHAVEGAAALLLGAHSVDHYDHAVGGSVQPDLTALLQAQVLSLDGRFEAAQQLYEKHLPQLREAGLVRLGCSRWADLAWCSLNAGKPTLAAQQAEHALQELSPGCDVDDRAVMHSRLAHVYAALGDPARAASHARQGEVEWQRYAAQLASRAQALRACDLVPR